MFVQSVKFVERHNGNRLKISVIGRVQSRHMRLAKMNLAIRGISYDLGERATSTFIDASIRIKVDFNYGKSAVQPEELAGQGRTY